MFKCSNNYIGIFMEVSDLERKAFFSPFLYDP